MTSQLADWMVIQIRELEKSEPPWTDIVSARQWERLHGMVDMYIALLVFHSGFPYPSKENQQEVHRQMKCAGMEHWIEHENTVWRKKNWKPLP